MKRFRLSQVSNKAWVIDMQGREGTVDQSVARIYLEGAATGVMGSKLV